MAVRFSILVFITCLLFCKTQVKLLSDEKEALLKEIRNANEKALERLQESKVTTPFMMEILMDCNSHALIQELDSTYCDIFKYGITTKSEIMLPIVLDSPNVQVLKILDKDSFMLVEEFIVGDFGLSEKLILQVLTLDEYEVFFGYFPCFVDTSVQKSRGILNMDKRKHYNHGAKTLRNIGFPLSKRNRPLFVKENLYPFVAYNIIKVYKRRNGWKADSYMFISKSRLIGWE